MRRDFGKCAVEVVSGDITTECVDAIVNAANESLRGGGGVDGAIHAAGGPAILNECIQLSGCATGDAKITTAGHMPAKHVIHTVGPVYRDGARGEQELLARCHRRSLEVALAYHCTSVAFPAISCGVYGYPIPEAAKIAMCEVKTFLELHGAPALVRFVMFGRATFDAFTRALKEA